jgi:hypothetical protein
MAAILIPDLKYKGSPVYYDDSGALTIPGGVIVPTQQPPQPQVDVVVPWKYQAGLVHTLIKVNNMLVFSFTIPQGYSSQGRLCNFSISPTDANAYWERKIALSDQPREISPRLSDSAMKTGQEPNVYFSVGGYPMKKNFIGISYADKSNADLVAGKTYYINVLQVVGNDCNINYGLSIA